MGEETRLKINDRSSYPPRVSVLTRRLGICYRRVTREKDRSFSLQARSYRPLQTISSSIFFILKRTVTRPRVLIPFRLPENEWTAKRLVNERYSWRQQGHTFQFSIRVSSFTASILLPLGFTGLPLCLLWTGNQEGRGKWTMHCSVKREETERRTKEPRDQEHEFKVKVKTKSYIEAPWRQEAERKEKRLWIRGSVLSSTSLGLKKWKQCPETRKS